MIPAGKDLTLRFALLEAVYELHENWFANHAVACRSGCSTCCTQSVTMTELEGLRIIEHFTKESAQKQLIPLLADRPRKSRQPASTNAYARLCLEGREPEESEETDWDMTPCPFLSNNRCSIYQVRPFMCRAFVSVKNCGDAGTAELPSHLVTANTVFMQIIEHLAQGMAWGNMLDVLRLITEKQEDSKDIAQENLGLSEPVPGFLIGPEESGDLQGLFAALENKQAEGKPLAAWLREKIAW